MLLGAKVGFDRILCPVAESPDSSEALSYATAICSSSGAKLYILHSIDPQRREVPFDPRELRRRIETSAGHYLDEIEKAPLDWEFLFVDGKPAVEIIREAAERRIDLIVMRSRRRPDATVLGSVAESVCRAAPCPVLVTHASERAWRHDGSGGGARILVAYDFSGDSELALSYGLSLAREYGSELHLLYVLPSRPRQTTPEMAGLPLMVQTECERALASLKNAVSGRLLAGLSVKRSIAEGQPYREILAYAEENDVGLICMGASGTGFGMRALFGSNSDRVLRQSPCPVLIARPLRPVIKAIGGRNGSRK